MKTDIVNETWGWQELWADLPEKYLGKTININMKKEIPYQYHEEKEKTIYTMRGVLSLYLKNGYTDSIKKIYLGPGDRYHIPPRTIHKISAEKGDVSLCEVSTYHTNDTVKLGDNYERK